MKKFDVLHLDPQVFPLIASYIPEAYTMITFIDIISQSNENVAAEFNKAGSIELIVESLRNVIDRHSKKWHKYLEPPTSAPKWTAFLGRFLFKYSNQVPNCAKCLTSRSNALQVPEHWKEITRKVRGDGDVYNYYCRVCFIKEFNVPWVVKHPKTKKNVRIETPFGDVRQMKKVLGISMNTMRAALINNVIQSIGKQRLLFAPQITRVFVNYGKN